MARLEDLKASSRRFIERYPFPNLGPSALRPLSKPLNACRVMLITTAGLHLKNDKPFAGSFWASDCSFRCLPAHARLNDLQISHTSEEFDRSGIMEDINVVYPIDRLEELAKEHKIGSIAGTHYSFMGSLFRVGELRKRTAPEVAQLALADGVDITILTPV